MTDRSLRHQQVIEDLLVLIRKFAGPNLLSEIAEGDSQAQSGDGEKHLAALHDLRDTYDWRLRQQPGNHWYPCEPIELIAYAVDCHSKAAQVFCNALLAVAELDGAEQDYMNYRWFRKPGEAWFRALDAPWLGPMIAAFTLRHAQSNSLERSFWEGKDANGTWIVADGGFND